MDTATLQIMKIVKQYLKDGGKLVWGDNATWKSAKLLPDSTSFGSYCQEVRLVFLEMDKMVYENQQDPFFTFGNTKSPFSYKAYMNHFLAESPSWSTSQIIATHMIGKTNSYYTDGECLIDGKAQNVRIVNQWFYRKKLTVKTVYGNIYVTNSQHHLPHSFDGVLDDETMTITIVE